MAKKATYPSVKRFGTRYGKTVRDKYGSIEVQQKKLYPCPHCGYIKVKRMSLGVWHCTKCENTMAGRAFNFEARKSVGGK
ncbi:MAG: 50S ribosomal protein L37ae [Candidatus Woesearchaeota archaeon]